MAPISKPAAVARVHLVENLTRLQDVARGVQGGPWHRLRSAGPAHLAPIGKPAGVANSARLSGCRPWVPKGRKKIENPGNWRR